MNGDQVSGKVVNNSGKPVRDVQILVKYVWLWNNERKPGTDSPGRAVYETLPGWRSSTAGVRRPADLPKAARRYIDRLSELCGAPIDIVSIGASRDQTIWMQDGPSGLAVRQREHEPSHP